MWKYYNPNPEAARVGDCSVRALSKALDQDWEQTYIDICVYGLLCGDMPSANAVWGRYLHDRGFEKHIVPYSCPLCTVESFSQSHDKGIYVMALNGHVVTIVDGCIYDTWDSSQEVPLYYWRKEK